MTFRGGGMTTCPDSGEPVWVARSLCSFYVSAVPSAGVSPVHGWSGPAEGGARGLVERPCAGTVGEETFAVLARQEAEGGAADPDEVYGSVRCPVRRRTAVVPGRRGRFRARPL